MKKSVIIGLFFIPTEAKRLSLCPREGIVLGKYYRFNLLFPAKIFRNYQTRSKELLYFSCSGRNQFWAYYFTKHPDFNHFNVDSCWPFLHYFQNFSGKNNPV